MAAEDLAFYSLAAIRDLLHRREIAARELVTSQLARLESVEGGLNAFITVTGEEARREAEVADRKLAGGEPAGPLHGVPLTLKDLLWTRGVRTTSGSKICADFVPQEDATVVARLREAGAIFLGKTNLHEFAYGISNVNPHYGPVRNPWDEERISGGSSGGSRCRLWIGGHRHRRIDPHSLGALRHRGTEADLRFGEPLRSHAPRLELGSRGADRSDGGGRRHPLRCPCRARSEGPHLDETQARSG
jgi:hypothetical protein